MKGYWLACSRRTYSRAQAKNWKKLSWKGEGSLALISLFFPSIAFALAVYDLTHSPPSRVGGRSGGGTFIRVSQNTSFWESVSTILSPVVATSNVECNFVLHTSTVHFLIPFQWSIAWVRTTGILCFSYLSTNSDLEILLQSSLGTLSLTLSRLVSNSSA